MKINTSLSTLATCALVATAFSNATLSQAPSSLPCSNGKFEERITCLASEIVRLDAKLATPGKDGKDGRDGRDGRDGKDGTNGKDAPIAPVTVTGPNLRDCDISYPGLGNSCGAYPLKGTEPQNLATEFCKTIQGYLGGRPLNYAKEPPTTGAYDRLVLKSVLCTP